MRFFEIASNPRAAADAVRQRVEAMTPEQQTALYEALVGSIGNWITGDGMVTASNDQFVKPFRLIASVINHTQRKRLRVVYRGTKMDTITPEVEAALRGPGAHKVVTSTKALQSWTTKMAEAVPFASWQDHAVGENGVVFASRASNLDIILTLADVAEDYFTMVDPMPYEIRSRWSDSMMGVYYDLERYKHQNEAIALTPPGGLVTVSQAKLIRG